MLWRPEHPYERTSDPIHLSDTSVFVLLHLPYELDDTLFISFTVESRLRPLV